MAVRDRRYGVSLLIGLLLAVAMTARSEAEGTAHNVLFLASEDSLLPATRILTDRVTASLRAEYPENLTIYTEFMDASRQRNGEAARTIVSALSEKYRQVTINLIFTIGPQALDVMLREHDGLFPATPVVFTGIRQDSPLLDQLPAGFGGVTTDLQLSMTLDLAVALQPGLQQIILITGASDFDRAWHDRALREIESYGQNFTVVDLAAMPLDTLFKALDEPRSNAAVLFLSMFQDGTGSTFVPSALAPQIAAHAQAPVYGVYPTFLGKGIVGGYVSTFESAGDAAAEMGLAALRDQDGAAPLFVVNGYSEYQVDSRALQRWDLDASLLPRGAQILFRPPSPVTEYWPFILAVALVIAAQSAIILAIWAQKRKRLRAEHALRQVNEHLDIAATTANVGLWSWRPAGDHVWLTSHCRRMLGLAEQSYTPLETFLTALAGQKRDGARRAMIWSLRTNGTFRGEYRTADGTGRETWLSAVGNCIRHGRELVIAGTLLDVSERKIAQMDAEQQRRQITHLTRVAVLGELSGALAHELNQPLTAILSNAQTAQRLMNRENSDIGELQEIVADIIEDNHRAGAVISKLRALIRREETQYAPLDLNQMVDDVLHLVHSDLIERQIQVRTKFGDNLPPARGDPVQIQQVLINLVRNACDAMSTAAPQPRSLVLATDRSGNDGLAVTVADSGTGIPDDMQERLFDPFVTTKPQGLGLGLTISQSILRAHGGKIWCRSNDGGGAVFGFSLPVFEGGMA